MKVGVLTVPFSGQPLPEALSYLRSLGVEALEIGCGGYPGKGHCNPRELLENKAKLKQFKEDPPYADPNSGSVPKNWSAGMLPRQYGQPR